MLEQSFYSNINMKFDKFYNSIKIQIPFVIFTIKEKQKNKDDINKKIFFKKCKFCHVIKVKTKDKIPKDKIAKG